MQGVLERLGARRRAHKAAHEQAFGTRRLGRPCGWPRWCCIGYAASPSALPRSVVHPPRPVVDYPRAIVAPSGDRTWSEAPPMGLTCRRRCGMPRVRRNTRQRARVGGGARARSRRCRTRCAAGPLRRGRRRLPRLRRPRRPCLRRRHVLRAGRRRVLHRSGHRCVRAVPLGRRVPGGGSLLSLSRSTGPLARPPGRR
jgi:hypothetical protein